MKNRSKVSSRRAKSVELPKYRQACRHLVMETYKYRLVMRKCSHEGIWIAFIRSQEVQYCILQHLMEAYTHFHVYRDVHRQAGSLSMQSNVRIICTVQICQHVNRGENLICIPHDALKPYRFDTSCQDFLLALQHRSSGGGG